MVCDGRPGSLTCFCGPVVSVLWHAGLALAGLVDDALFVAVTKPHPGANFIPGAKTSDAET